MKRVAALAALLLFGSAVPAFGQEFEPRAYSASPVDTSYAVVTYTNSKGSVSLDPSLPLSDVHASIGTIGFSFTHTFRLGRRTGSWAIALPYVSGNATGTAHGMPGSLTRDGFPDARARLGINLLGRALTPAEFARRKPSTTFGVSATLVAPTGTYDPARLINIGSNRWSLRPEIGLEQPMGKWFADFAAAIWFFGRNADYFGGQMLEQAPLTIYQVHTGYNFRPGQWLAVDWNRYTGGATSANSAPAINELANSRYGFAFSQPIGPGFSAKLAWSHWLTGQYGQNFSTVGLQLQYRWFREGTPGSP